MNQLQQAIQQALAWIEDAVAVLQYTSDAVQGGVGAEAEGVGGCSVRVLDDLRAALEQPAEEAQGQVIAQALSDPEKQPNKFGVEFGMTGANMHFKIGSQLFRLAYEPDEQEDFEFMKRMLIKAFSTFTPDVKTQPATHGEPAAPAAVAQEPTTMPSVSKDLIRRTFLAHGFTVKDGQTDLKPYVYEAAYALLNAAASAAVPDGYKLVPVEQLAEWKSLANEAAARGLPTERHQVAQKLTQKIADVVNAVPEPTAPPPILEDLKELFKKSGKPKVLTGPCGQCGDTKHPCFCSTVDVPFEDSSPTGTSHRQPLTTEQYTKLAHRIASRYSHRSDPQFIAYTFLPHTLEQFVRAIESAISNQ